MKLLVDNQLPPALAAHLGSLGHDCAHVIDAGLERADDLELWTRCLVEQRIVVSKDD